MLECLCGRLLRCFFSASLFMGIAWHLAQMRGVAISWLNTAHVERRCSRHGTEPVTKPPLYTSNRLLLVEEPPWGSPQEVLWEMKVKREVTCPHFP